MKKIAVFGRGKATPTQETRSQEYKKRFLRKTSFIARSGKTVCVSLEHHERIYKILRVIGKNEVSMSDYLHNVLEHHFATCKDDISRLYEDGLERNLF